MVGLYTVWRMGWMDEMKKIAEMEMEWMIDDVWCHSLP